jgi:ABC-type Na+ efflux pump permease subunit
LLLRIWRIFWHEYKGHLTRKSYLIFTFGFPLFMVLAPVVGGLMLALAFWSALPEPDLRPVGVVDQVALLGEEPDYPAGPVEITRFKTPAEAQTALEQGHIQAYYDLPPDYWETGQVIATYETAPTSDIDNMVTGWIENKVQDAVPADILTRFRRGRPSPIKMWGERSVSHWKT